MLREAWTLAIETLSWMQMQRLNEDLALARTVKQMGIADANARRLAFMLVCETTRRQNFIDAFISKAIKTQSISEFDLGIQAFLRLYVYQTRMQNTSSKISLREAERIVKLGRSILGWKTMQKVEHVLGLLLTQPLAAVYANAVDEERVGLLTYHPTWFVKYCFRLFGRSEALALLEGGVTFPPTYIRLNTLKADENAILEKLAEEGVKTEKVDSLQCAYEIADTKQPLTRVEGFAEGLFYIQDKASIFVGEVANPQPGMTVLDICAAPGAKTTHLAQLMQNQGVIYSLDYSRRRMAVWRKELARMTVQNATAIIADARNSLPFDLEADVVVLDLPCTNTGTFGKSPSAKWRLTVDSIDRMAGVQWHMLDNCAQYVKPRGTLVYSTCSMTVEENEMQIERFLKWHAEFSLTEITPKIGSPGLRGMEKCQRLYPHIHGCNGSFVARLCKSEP